MAGRLKQIFNKELLIRIGRQGMQTLVRFPLVMGLFAALAVLLIYRVDLPYEQWETIGKQLDRITFIVGAGIAFALAGEMLLERTNWKEKWPIRLGVYGLQLATLGLYYRFWLPDPTEMVPSLRLFLLGLGFFVCFVWIPYFYRRTFFETYVVNIVSRWFITVFYAVVLGIGLSSVLFAVETLLLDSLESRWYAYIWILVGTVFAPLFFLSALPTQDDELSLEDYGKIFRGLFLFILLPVLTAFTAVLYAYFVRILVTRSWPSDQVSYLVGSYGVVGLLSVFVIEPLRRESSWADRFSQAFRWGIIPLLVMMFISIGMRVNQYGVTERRYFVILLGLWLVINTVYFHLIRGRRNIFVPISLAVVLFLAAVGPLSAFTVSRWSQNSRFSEILTSYDMLADDEIRTADSELDMEDQREIYQILQYFDRVHSLEKVKYLPDGFAMEEDDFRQVFDISLQDIREMRPDQTPYFSFWREDNAVLDISGYDRSFVLYGSSFDRSNEQSSRRFDWNGRSWEAGIEDEWILVLRAQDQIVLRWDLMDDLNEVIRLHGIGLESKREQLGDELIWSREEDGLRIRLVVQSVDGQVLDNGLIQLQSLYGTVMLGQLEQ